MLAIRTVSIWWITLTLLSCVPKQPERQLAADEIDSFGLDIKHKDYDFAVEGMSSYRLVAHLTDSEGKRALFLKQGSAQEIEVAAAGWNLPPAASVNSDGAVLICYNRLTGTDTQRTVGVMPDPTTGLSLFCRLKTATSLGPEGRLGDKVAAPWLRDIDAQSDGSFRVTYYGDDGDLGAAQGGFEAYYAQSVRGDVIGDIQMTRSVCSHL